MPSSHVDIMDVASVELGGLCVAYSDAHYGHPRNLIKVPTINKYFSCYTNIFPHAARDREGHG